MNLMLNDYAAILASLGDERRLRSLRHAQRVECNLLDCTSNDYMGIGRSRDFTEEFFGTLSPQTEWGSCASRLLYTEQENGVYTELESFLKEFYGREALIFNSGYHINTGIIPALSLPGTLIVADKLVHASIIDGIRLSSANYKRFRHNDVTALQRILDNEADNYKRIIVVVESVYSMDGDCAPLLQIVGLKKIYSNVMLYVDEAHGFGVKGLRGLGLCEQLNIVADVDVIVATMSKAVASVGAFAIIDDVMKDYLINSCRSLIFSTAIPPVSVAWSLFVIRKLIDMTEERRHLNEMNRQLCDLISSLRGTACESDSPIIPFIVSGNENVIRASEIMKNNGVKALPIRRPTVAAGAERLRISLNAAMDSHDISLISNALKAVVNELHI